VFNPLDGPSAQESLTVTSATVQEAKAGASRLSERQVVTIQPSQKIYVYFGDGVSTPNAATVSSKGIVQYKDQLNSYEASSSQPIFILAVSTTATVKVIERA
jgi:hypothetical protein